MPLDLSPFKNDICNTVKQALLEDIGSDAAGNLLANGDITAQLIPAESQATARIISRDRAIIAGSAWVNEVFSQLDPSVCVNWKVSDGQWVRPNQVLFELTGSARSLLTGERAALNFLQTLSATATLCQHYAQIVEGTGVKLLDTRKTLPGLRIGQKYAVSLIDGCNNHRIGLYDAFLIKENHIHACGSIKQAVEKAHLIAPGKKVEVEVESLEELTTALKAGADIIMLDNFSPALMVEAVALNKTFANAKNASGIAKRAKLEASGGITTKTLRAYAETGVDYISIGALTKDCTAVDLSMRLV
ncbi:MAG: carboxylating nicotinate-nucleotide diphosphorylase [Oleispira antarctica]|nr:carboxylating nicotinate-nucleotide diphosphorylase [Oleispira antarctica]MBQ0791631.1 carboxylating nicotinate-nucleotide diphosphorylase [Oleispira antarctica]